jgi:hypothetical protein
MCEEMPVIPANRAVVPKRRIGKMEDQGGGEAQGVADPKKQTKKQKMTQKGKKSPNLVTLAESWTTHAGGIFSLWMGGCIIQMICVRCRRNTCSRSCRHFTKNI